MTHDEALRFIEKKTNQLTKSVQSQMYSYSCLFLSLTALIEYSHKSIVIVSHICKRIFEKTKVIFFHKKQLK